MFTQRKELLRLRGLSLDALVVWLRFVCNRISLPSVGERTSA